MKELRIVFFGSTSDSVIILDKLFKRQTSNVKLLIAAVVTQPPRPVGRHHELTPTPIEAWAKEHSLTVLSFPNSHEKQWMYEDEQTVIDTLQPLKADLIISASYGQMIPAVTLRATKYGGLNVHPSILPRWRGGDPVPWAILSGDHQIGVTVVTLGEKFDEGRIIAQKKIPITPTDVSTPLRTALFTIGADLLIEILPEYLDGSLKGKPQVFTGEPYARRFQREDGFEKWEMIQKALETGEEAGRLERKYRALHPWPGLWTKIVTSDKRQVKSEKRLKILSCHLSPVTSHLEIDEVQLEGKTPTTYKQFAQSHLSKNG